MNKVIKTALLSGILVLGLGTTTNVANAAQTDKKAINSYSYEGEHNHKGVLKLMGKNWKYRLYEFKLTKKVNFYYLHHSDKATMYNKIIGQKSIPKGTVITAEYSGTGGAIWNVYGYKTKLPKNVSFTAVLTNKNAKVVNGNYQNILKQAENNKYSH